MQAHDVGQMPSYYDWTRAQSAPRFWWFWQFWIQYPGERWSTDWRAWHYRAFGPVEETAADAYQLQRRIGTDYTVRYVIRWIWAGRRQVWSVDDRSEPDWFAESQGLRPDRWA